jgi:hypothetical protein
MIGGSQYGDRPTIPNKKTGTNKLQYHLPCHSQVYRIIVHLEPVVFQALIVDAVVLPEVSKLVFLAAIKPRPGL